MKISTENSNYTFVWFYTAIYMKISTEHSNFFCLAFFLFCSLYTALFENFEHSNHYFVCFYTSILY